jgi:hypothetical protein
VQPTARPTARQTLDESLITLLMMLLRALIAGRLPKVAPPDPAALPLWHRLVAATSPRATTAEPATGHRSPLECVLIAPPSRRRRGASCVLGPIARRRGIVPFSPVPVLAQANPPRARLRPRSRPPPPVPAGSVPAARRLSTSN